MNSIAIGSLVSGTPGCWTHPKGRLSLLAFEPSRLALVVGRIADRLTLLMQDGRLHECWVRGGPVVRAAPIPIDDDPR